MTRPSEPEDRVPTDAHEPAAPARPNPAAGLRDVEDDEDDSQVLLPPPLRLYALFILPLVLLMLWALFLK